MANNATVVVVGNLTKEPTKSTVNNQPVMSFTVAVNTTIKKTDGDGYESNFYNCGVWGKSVDYLMEHLQKGTQVQVTGDLVLEKYTSKNGAPGQSMNIRASKVIPLARQKNAKAESTPEVPFPFA